MHLPQQTRWLIATIIFGSLLAAADVTITRDLPDSVLTTDTTFQVTVTVAITDAAPNGLIITETLPNGWIITDATWDGADLPPVRPVSDYKWLIGGPGAPTPALGNTDLVYTVSIGGGRTTEYTFAGNGKWFDSGTAITTDITGDTTVNALTPTAVTKVEVTGEREVEVTFSADMPATTPTGANFLMSGSGLGTYSNNPSPDSVVRKAATTTVYVLTWDPGKGEMLIGGDVTIAVNNTVVIDDAGHLIGGINSGTDIDGGLGTVPTATFLPDPALTHGSSSLDLDLTFSEPVQGLDATDLVLTGTAKHAGTTIATPIDQGGNVWRFSITGLQSGTLNVSLAPNANDIEDLAGNDLGNLSFSYTIDVTAPVITDRSPAPGSAISTSSINIDVTFSEDVQAIDKTAFRISGAAAVGATVDSASALSANQWRFALSALKTGSLNVSLGQELDEVEDLVGNDLDFIQWSYTVDVTPPTVTAFAPVEADGIHIEAAAITINVTFSENVTDVDTTDLVLSGAGAATATVTGVSGSGNSYTFTVTGLQDGAVTFSLGTDADDINDLVGHDLVQYVDNTFVVDLPKYHPYDANQDWTLQNSEIATMKTAWANGNLPLPPGVSDPDFYVLWALEIREPGEYTYDRTQAGFRIWKRVNP